MSDMIDAFRAMKRMRIEERRVFGVPCPTCLEKLPKAQPKILMHGQVCRAHKPNYRDPRPAPTRDEYNAAMAHTGWSRSQ